MHGLFECRDELPADIARVAKIFGLALTSCQDVARHNYCPEPTAAALCPVTCGTCQILEQRQTVHQATPTSCNASTEEIHRMNAALVRASHHDWRWHHNKTSQQGANCVNGWCKVGEGLFKTVWESPSSPLVLKLATLSGTTGETPLRAEWSRLSMLCALEAGMISHRVPWSAEPFRASANAPEMLAQARITGHVIRIKDGASFYGALPRLWEDPTSSLPRSSASALKLASELLQWELFVQRSRQPIADFQLMLQDDGSLWIIDSSFPGYQDPVISESDSGILQHTGLARPAPLNYRHRQAYAWKRQRASLLSYAIAAATYAAGDLPLLRELLCSGAACELGCSLLAVPQGVRRALASHAGAESVSARALHRLGALLSPGSTEPPLAPIHSGGQCSPCTIPDGDEVLLRYALLRYAQTRCNLGNDAASLAWEDALRCVGRHTLDGQCQLKVRDPHEPTCSRPSGGHRCCGPCSRCAADAVCASQAERVLSHIRRCGSSLNATATWRDVIYGTDTRWRVAEGNGIIADEDADEEM